MFIRRTDSHLVVPGHLEMGTLVGAKPPAGGGTLTLQPDATAGQDTYHIQSDPSGNYGTDTVLKTRNNDPSWDRYSFIKFDVSSISGETVTSAYLHLWNESTTGSNKDFSVHSILSANSNWAEASLSWNWAATSFRWAGDTGSDGGNDAGCSVSGTDYNATALGTFSYTANDPQGTEHICTLTTSQVQDWVDGNNYGLIIIITSAGDSILDFYSSDHTTAGERPKLVVNY